MGKILIHIFVRVAWWLPGRPHRWACRLYQERAAMQQATKAMERRKKQWENAKEE
jgi:hypothetical protein